MTTKEDSKITINSKSLVKIALMTSITVGLSFVKVPFYPVPFTLQTLAAMLAGILLKKWEGVSSQIIYILLGLIGIPIFSQGGGIGYIFNPTFGYLLFLPVLTLLVNILWKRLKIFGIIIPSVCLLFFGTFYYIVLFSVPLDNGIWKILINFAVIFIPAEILKSFCAYFLGKKLKIILKI